MLTRPGSWFALGLAAAAAALPATQAVLAGPRVLAQKGVLTVDGKPFFPFGLFCTAWTRDEIVSCLDDAARHGFNTVHSYWAADVCRSQETVRTYLDEAQKRGLEVLPTIGSLGQEAALFREGKLEELEALVRGWVRPFKDHPALLAWYVWDEPNAEGFAAPPECVRAVGEYVKREDPNHPTFFAFTPWLKPDALPRYAGCCDILCLDPYVFANYMHLVPQSLDSAAVSAQGRPIWSLLWGCWNSDSRAPTVDETRCSTYLSLIHGATGILYYGHLSEAEMRGKGEKWQRGLADPQMQPLYDAVAQLGREIRELAPALRAPLPQEMVAIEPPSPALHCRTFREKRGIVVLAANEGKEPVAARLRPKGRARKDGVSVLFGSTRLPMADGAFSDTLPPLGSRAYRIRWLQ